MNEAYEEITQKTMDLLKEHITNHVYNTTFIGHGISVVEAYRTCDGKFNIRFTSEDESSRIT